MADYRICFSVAEAFGAELTLEVKTFPSVPYEDVCKLLSKEKLAEMLCLESLGYKVNDIKFITPDAYDREYGEQANEDAENGVTDDNDQA